MKERCKYNVKLKLPENAMFRWHEVTGLNPDMGLVTVSRRLRDLVNRGKLVRTGRKGEYCQIRRTAAQAASHALVQTEIKLETQPVAQTEIKLETQPVAQTEIKSGDQNQDVLKALYMKGILAVTFDGKYVIA